MLDDRELIEILKNNFLRISEIPRKSGQEEKISDFFTKIARENGLYYFKDKNNNVLIKKKGTALGAEPVALQAHLDMVYVEDEGVQHDFEKDGIKVIFDGDKVTAEGTSLGADQGVGLAIMLTLLEDKSLSHPDLEFLFTVEEETTFKGAVTFPYDKVKSKRLINLDNSKDDTVFVGADGDICNEYRFKGKLVQNDLPSYKVRINGFPGGNSGENVSLSGNNAITTMARLLNGKEIFLRSIDGGTAENDLATTCQVVLNTDINIYDVFKDTNVKIEPINNKTCFSKNDTIKILNEILELKGGFISDDLASANLGLISTTKNEIKICYILRSMNANRLKEIDSESKLLKNDFVVTEIYTDPIWEINPDSIMLRKYKELYFKKIFFLS